MSEEFSGPPIWKTVDTGVGPPSATDSRAKIDLIRTGFEFGWKLHCCLLGDDIIRMRTHYTSRTVGCLKKWQTCYYCDNNLETRWSGYAACICREWPGLCILDITPGIAAHFDDYLREHKTLRGCAVELYREKNKPTKRVKVGGMHEAKDEVLATLPPNFNVLQQMFVIWEMKIPRSLATELYHDSTHANRLNDYLDSKRGSSPPTEEAQTLERLIREIPIKVNGSK